MRTSKASGTRKPPDRLPACQSWCARRRRRGRSRLRHRLQRTRRSWTASSSRPWSVRTSEASYRQPITRRRFVAGAAATGLSLAAGCHSGAQSRRRASVVVVGAGLAGLAAAHELDRAGFRLTVLEARARVGGRVQTLRRFAGGQHVEAGGEYIDTIHTSLLAYAKRFELELEDAQAGPDLNGAVYLNGRRRSDSAVYTPAVQGELDRLDARLTQLAQRVDAADPLARGAAFDRKSLANLMDELGMSGVARVLAESDARDEYG